jgi:hypothetical protein
MKSCTMNSFKLLLIYPTLLCAIELANAQGSFQNLNFESATLVPITGDSFGRFYFDQAFPGWRGYVGGIQQTAAFHNAEFLCCSALTVWGGASHPELPFEGSYSVFFHAALGNDFQPADTALAQIGQIPTTAQSLLFKARSAGPFTVSLGGQPVSPVPLLSAPDYTLFGADISAWAGQQTELRFTSIAPAAGTGDNSLILDSIEFSTTPIPEPSTFALFGFSVVFAWFIWRHKRQRNRIPRQL